MTDTPYLGLPNISSGQSDKTVTHNDGLQILDVIVQRGVVDRGINTPPGSPSNGDAYIVGSSPTGAWSGHANTLAYYWSGWQLFITPKEGFTVWVNDEDVHYVFDGASWVISSGGGGGGARVRAATTANITIATALNNGDSLDGVTLATDDLVLVKNQSAPEENGIYRVGVSPTRDSSYSTYDSLAGLTVTVMEGTANADKDFICTSNYGGTINSNGLTFVDLSTRITFSSLLGISLTTPQTGDMLRYNGTNWVNEAPPYDVGISRTAGIPASLAAMIDYTFTRTVVFPASLSGSYANASVAATAQTNFDIQKNGSSIGTMRFAAAATTATFVGFSQTTFSAGDKLRVVAPSSPDATLADVAFTFAGTRS